MNDEPLYCSDCGEEEQDCICPTENELTINDDVNQLDDGFEDLDFDNFEEEL